MSLLSMLGLDDLEDSIKELTEGIDDLKKDIVESVIGPGEDLKKTVNDIAGSIKSGDAPSDK